MKPHITLWLGLCMISVVLGAYNGTQGAAQEPQPPLALSTATCPPGDCPLLVTNGTNLAMGYVGNVGAKMFTVICQNGPIRQFASLNPKDYIYGMACTAQDDRLTLQCPKNTASSCDWSYLSLNVTSATCKNPSCLLLVTNGTPLAIRY